MARETDNAWVPTAAAVLIAAVAGGAFFVTGPLQSRRPLDGGRVPQMPPGDELVMARLWQDPLHAVGLHWQDVLERGYEGGALAASMDAYTRRAVSRELPQTINGLGVRHQPQLRLLVMMPSTPYVEDRESRRRQRHAVVTALTARGFIPASPEHLGYFVMPRPMPSHDDGATGCDAHHPVARCIALIGFERYKPRPGTPGKPVEVLWLNSQDFIDLDQVAVLLAALGHSHDNTAVLLGPYTSGALRAFVEDSWEVTPDFLTRLNGFPADVRRILSSRRDSSRYTAPTAPSRASPVTRATVVDTRRRLHVLSPWATAPLHLLLRGDGVPAGKTDSWLQNTLEVKLFRSVVAKDDVVLRDILRELKARGACRQARPWLALVVEQDTEYGQIFTDIVADLRKRRRAPCEFEAEPFGYLRGLDGELPPDNYVAPGPPNGVDGVPPGDNAVEPGLLTGVRRSPAFGTARLDYVRRLADVISQHEAPGAERYRRGLVFPSHRRPVAVGVLGSDFYDKLLILQALRERMPGTVFFTTDLDARLTDPSNYAVLRNVIVGSSYGFTIANSASGFRNSYEAALYRSVALVLDDVLAYVSAVPCPRLFEVARTGAVDISRYEAECQQAAQVHGSVTYLRSGTGIFVRALAALLVLAPVLGLTTIAYGIARNLPRGARRDAHRRVAKTGAVSAFALLVLAYYLTRHEPWPFFEGVSSIPAFLIQVTTVVFAVCFGIIARGRLVQGQADIAEEFELSSKAPAEQNSCRQPGIVAWTRSLNRARDEKAETSLGCVWAMYVHLGNPTAALRRRSLSVIGLAALLIAVIGADIGGVVLSRDLHRAMEFAGVMMTLVMLASVFYCMDALMLAGALVREIARSGRSLPQPPVEQWRGELAVKRHYDFVWQRRRKMALVVECTEVLVPIMVLPFVLLLLPVAGANTLSEGWHWTWRLCVLYGGFTIFVLVRALMFQFEAVRAKETILGELDEYREKVVGAKEQRRRLALAIAEIEGIQRGAFVPWTRHPILQSIGATGVAIATLLGALL